ncbi:hypothetical protein [Acinetobacter johnsonii]|uniref:hypothetical protein n=1 Tax=Acinetobacter johnsonii TaxID=40214 RepID=UPI002D7F86A1|nr:hypothetical protein [Acinetobacter johnsonii]
MKKEFRVELKNLEQAIFSASSYSDRENAYKKLTDRMCFLHRIGEMNGIDQSKILSRLASKGIK